MTKLPVYDNHTKLNLTDDNHKKALDLLGKIAGASSFFRQILTEKANMAEMTDSNTYMGLIESYFSELSPLVKYDSVLAEERQNRYTEIKSLRQEISDLESKLGETVTPEGLTAALRRYQDTVRCFYGALGFQYARLDECTAWSVVYTFTSELQYEPDDGTSGMKELSAKFIKQFGLLASPDTVFDIYRDKYHAELLDTDNNKRQIQTLFTDVFPNIQFHKFESRRNDYNSFSLRFTVALSYQDIQNLYDRPVRPGEVGFAPQLQGVCGLRLQKH